MIESLCEEDGRARGNIKFLASAEWRPLVLPIKVTLGWASMW